MANASSNQLSSDDEQETEPDWKRTTTMIITMEKLQKESKASENACNLDAQEYKSSKRKKKKKIIEIDD